MSDTPPPAPLSRVDSRIDGVRWTVALTFHDTRGYFSEMVRASSVGRIAQVNVSSSVGGTVRGMHIHYLTTDVWYVASGTMMVCVQDSDGNYDDRLLSQGDGVIIQPGIAHGFFAIRDCLLIYAQDREHDHSQPDDHGYDPFSSGLPWPVDYASAIMSVRDSNAVPYADIKDSWKHHLG